MIFPIIFIFTGLALATIKPIREGRPRLLSPSIFPTPSNLYYNDIVPFTLNQTSSIIQSDFLSTDADRAIWDGGVQLAVPVGADQKDISLKELVCNLDNKIFDDRKNVPNGFFGSYFIYNLNTTDNKDMNFAAVALINATS